MQLPADGVDDKDERLLGEKTSREFEESSEYSSDEEDVEGGERGELPGAVQVLPHSLSDQLKLLTPSSHRNTEQQDTAPRQSPAISDLYSTVNKKKSSRAKSEGEESSSAHLESDSHRNRSGSLTGSSGTGNQKPETPEKSLFMHDLTPPWKQMVRAEC